MADIMLVRTSIRRKKKNSMGVFDRIPADHPSETEKP